MLNNRYIFAKGSSSIIKFCFFLLRYHRSILVSEIFVKIDMNIIKMNILAIYLDFQFFHGYNKLIQT